MIADAAMALFHYQVSDYLFRQCFHLLENNQVSKQLAQTPRLFTVFGEFLKLEKQRKSNVCAGKRSRCLC